MRSVQAWRNRQRADQDDVAARRTQSIGMQSIGMNKAAAVPRVDCEARRRWR